MEEKEKGHKLSFLLMVWWLTHLHSKKKVTGLILSVDTGCEGRATLSNQSHYLQRQKPFGAAIAQL